MFKTPLAIRNPAPPVELSEDELALASGGGNYEGIPGSRLRDNFPSRVL
jgi:hypothetical protein